jgi:hypothetical protein
MQRQADRKLSVTTKKQIAFAVAVPLCCNEWINCRGQIGCWKVDGVGKGGRSARGSGDGDGDWSRFPTHARARDHAPFIPIDLI